MFYGHTVIRDTFGGLLKSLCRYLNEAPEVESRIGKTKEMICPTIVLTNPENSLCYCEQRNFNFIYALVEASMMFRNDNDVRMFSYFNRKMLDYSDDGKILNSAYGQFVAPNIHAIVNKLSADPNTRQAVISIYNNDFCCIDSKDIPCTQTIQFLIRDEKLVCIVHMRSNDVFWGLQYDLYMFTNLQRAVAKALRIECGPYIHMPASLHVYDYHYDALQRIANNEVSVIDFPAVNVQRFEAYRNGMDNVKFFINEYNEEEPNYTNIISEIRKGNISNALILIEIAYRTMTGREFNDIIDTLMKDEMMLDVLTKYIIFFRRWFRRGV